MLNFATAIVRSSAVGEDSADASFAGQLDSIADVTSPQALRDAIDRVWASQRSERVLAYQAARGMTLAGMGVIVQRQVTAAVSGVLFTRSPADPEQMLLEYCEGMGEALVSGALNPGRVAIDRDVAEGAVGWALLAPPDDTVVHEALLLNDKRMAELARLALDRNDLRIGRRTSNGRSMSRASCGSCRAVRSPRHRTSRCPRPHRRRQQAASTGPTRTSTRTSPSRSRRCSTRWRDGLLPLLPQSRHAPSACPLVACRRWSRRFARSSASTARGCTTTSPASIRCCGRRRSAICSPPRSTSSLVPKTTAAGSLGQGFRLTQGARGRRHRGENVPGSTCS